MIMGMRGRNAEKKTKFDNKNKLREALKDLTRTKALRELQNGADFNNTKYTEHRNYHVRYRAWYLSGEVIPDNAGERERLFKTLSKGRSLAGQIVLEEKFKSPEAQTKVA